MKIKYRKSDNIIVAMGECAFTEDADFAVAQVDQEIPDGNLSHYQFNGVAVEKRLKSDIDSEENAKKNDRKSRKQAVRIKLGLTKAEITALKELLEDGSED